MKRPPVLHPFLFAAFPALSLYAVNLTQVHFSDALRPLAVSEAAAALLILLFRLLGKNWWRAGMAASLALVLFFSFGHVYGWIWTTFPASIFGHANILMALWASGLIVGVWAALRLPRKTRRATLVLNWVSAAALLFTLTSPLWKAVEGFQVGAAQWKQPADLDPRPGPGWNGEKPDIYYIILDGYGREDVLRSYYGVDNSAFLEGLRRRGFTVANRSATNYWKTPLSLPSSLNFHYLDELADLPHAAGDPRTIESMIGSSAARRFLESLGYHTVAFSTNFYFSDLRGADVYYPSNRPLSAFEVNLLTGSMAIFWVDWAGPLYHRQDVTEHFDDLAHSAALEGPKFVFAHMVVPHPPFVFDARGEAAAPKGGSDGNAYIGGVEHYLSGYAGQVQYTSRVVEETVDAILAHSKTPPVIILQADHGPGAYLNWQSVDATCLRERFGILNAYYLPGKETAARTLPEDISPVNSFRVVFNAYFDTRLQLLPDRHYAVYDDDLTHPVEVTGRLDSCTVSLRKPPSSPESSASADRGAGK